MKSTWPVQELCVEHPKEPIFHWHMLGETQILGLGSGVRHIFAYLDTNMFNLYTKRKIVALGV